MPTNQSPDPNAGPTLVTGNATQNAAQQQNSDLTNLQTPNIPPPNLTANANNAAVDPGATAPNSSSGGTIQIAPVGRNNAINSNPLDGYIDVTYGISLAMVSKAGVNIIANAPVSTQPQAGDVPGIDSSQYMVFASTGDILTTSGQVSADYYNIKGCVFTTFFAHLPQNPMTATIVDAKIHLFEPYGFQLRQDMDSMRQQLGYEEQIEPLNLIYRLEIWFSGWNPQTGQWVQRIPFELTDSVQMTSVIYYMSITTIDATVSTTGTEYFLSMQIMAHRPLRPESLILRMGNISLIPNGANPSNSQNGTVTSINYGQGTEAATFKDFCLNLGALLQQQVKYDTSAGTFPGLDITYNFYFPDWLGDAKFDGDPKSSEVAHGAVNYSSDSGTYVYASQDIDIITLIYKVMDNIALVRELTTQQADVVFLNPSVFWNIRTNMHYPGAANGVINGYDTYTFDYFIEPVLSYRSRTTTPENRNTRVDQSNQQNRTQAMLGFGMIMRVYQFFFSNLNSEVIDLDFQFHNFYQEPFPTNVKTVRGESQTGVNADYQTESTNQQAQTVPPPSVNFAIPPTSSTASQILGQPSNPQSAATGTQSAAYKFQGMIRQQDPQPVANMSNSQSQPDMALYQYSKQQYFRYDMIDVNMTVRFDPTWLLTPYQANGDYTPRLPTDDGQTVLTHLDRCVLLQANAPTQSDFMNPYRTSGSSTNQDHLSGFYQVISVVNEFDGGKFTQKLNMYKYPHLNGYSTLQTNSQPNVQNPTGSTPTTTPQPNPGPTNQSPDPNASSSLGAIT
jgi:hypothetical protein